MSRILPVIALGTVLLAACGTPKLDNSQRAKIVGDWVNPQNGARLSIYADGEFQLDLAGSQILGVVERGGNELSIRYTVPATLCQGSSGLYRFERKGNVLNFDIVRDDCPERATQILQYWTSASEPEDVGPTTPGGKAPIIQGEKDSTPRRMRPGQR